jgi:23S rRNA pseudouridine955/2504/2580 synthase
MNSFPILYENNEILLINKPAGIAVQGGVGIAHPLDETLSGQVGYKVYLVHRLDRETAGILVVAKNSAAARKWIALVAGGQVCKEYTALCFGLPLVDGRKPASGTISFQLNKNGREVPAVTRFTVERQADMVLEAGLEPQPVSLLRLILGTGRTHQIRIHLAKSFCPIVGDDLHGNFKMNRYVRKEAGIKNLLLAATRITLPVSGCPETFSIPLPPYMQQFLDTYFV